MAGYCAWVIGVGKLIFNVEVFVLAGLAWAGRRPIGYAIRA